MADTHTPEEEAGIRILPAVEEDILQAAEHHQLLGTLSAVDNFHFRQPKRTALAVDNAHFPPLQGIQPAAGTLPVADKPNWVQRGTP